MDTTREAYSRPSPALNLERLPEFFKGRALFRQSWVIPPAEEIEIAGLGPLYMDFVRRLPSQNARGKPPDPRTTTRRAADRLSVPGRSENGGPRPHPVYGDQLQNHGIPGVAEEGKVSIEYEEFAVTLADGETVFLRKPKIVLSELRYGPLGDDVLTSARVGPAVFGLGLLEAVSDETLLDLERRCKRTASWATSIGCGMR